MEVVRRSVAFLMGLFFVFVGAFDECNRASDIVIGLLLMGIFTVPDALAVFRRESPSKEE